MTDMNDIIDTLESLALHCRPPLMSVEDRSRWLRDWCDDLREFPIEATRQAAMKWRRGDVQKFPTPGQFLPMVRAFVGAGGAAPQVAEPWKPIGDEAYDRLTLTEKIRHQRILANEAYGKAGPMWRGGKPATAEEMPESWHVWRQRARNHDDEAMRLRKIMENAQTRRAEESGAA